MSRSRKTLGRTATAVGIAALTVVTAAGCTTTASSNPQSTPAAGASSGKGSGTGPIVIGQTAGLTGFMSVFDVPVQQGMKMAIADINAKGGVLGRQLKFVSNDNQTDSTKIQSSAKQLIESGAQFIVPSCDYDIGGPAARQAKADNVIAIGCAGGPQFGFQGIGANTYNTHISSPAEGSVMAKWAFSKGYKRPYVVIDQGLDYSQSAGQFFAKEWKALGGSLAGQDTFQNLDASAASQVTDIQQAKPDLIVAASYPPGGATLIQQIRSAGINTDMMGLQAFDGTYWLKSIPTLSNFYIPAVASMWGDDPRPAINQFFDRIKTETGSAAASAFYPLSGYSSVEALAYAIRAAGTTDTAAVEAQLNKFHNQNLLIGLTSYSATCHIPGGRPQLIEEYVDGKPKVVATDVSITSVPGGNPC